MFGKVCMSSTSSGDGTPICRQKVLVYKPPGLHQGDVHVFDATWNKEIEAVVGTATYGIMFSTKGARSITDEMAGSDLDEDQYWVSWNPELVDSFTPSAPWEPPNVQDEEPLPRPLDEDTFETLHFNKFIQARFDPSKIKGMSANAWLTLTDHMSSCNVNESEKLHAKERIPTIVNLFYDSLDADKSGKEVKWSKELQCSIYPHFLEKNTAKDEMSPDKKTWNGSASKTKLPVKTYHQYTSTSVLGRVYDLVKKEDFNTLLEGLSLTTFFGTIYMCNCWNFSSQIDRNSSPFVRGQRE